MIFPELLKAHGKETLKHLFLLHDKEALEAPDEYDGLLHSIGDHASVQYLPDKRLLHIRHFQIPDSKTGKGFGTRAFVRQVLAARKLGIAKITLRAMRGRGLGEMNGYYTWPRLGFDDARGTFKGIMADPQQRADWKESGNSRNLFFDVHPDSEHSKRLLAYVKEKGIKV